MSAVKDLVTEYHLLDYDSDLAIETALDIECAVRTWQRYLEDTGRIYQ